MEDEHKNNGNAEPETNDSGTGVLVSEKTEDVTVDKRQMNRQDRGLGEENHGDDFLGKANKKKDE